MKSNPEMIAVLNALLTDELTALDQYKPHEARAHTWGFGVFVTYIDERIADEEKHAKALIRRIYELEGVPDTVARNPVNVAPNDIIDGLRNDREAEIGAIAKYNEAIRMATEYGDNATRDMLEDNLKDEDDHLVDIEKRLVQVVMVTPAQWLSTQIR